MAYDEGLAQRLRDALAEERGISEKRMFGGLCLLVEGKMCVGIVKDELMVRVGPEKYEAALARPGARPMDFTGKPMTGFVFVSQDGMGLDRELEEWVQLGVTFARTQEVKRPRASAPKKRRARGRGSLP